MTIDNLNVYQLIEIFEFLTLEERLVCSRTCRKFRSAVNFLGIQQLTVFYLAKPDQRRSTPPLTDHSSGDSSDDSSDQRIQPLNHQNGHPKSDHSDSTDKRFIVHIRTDRLLEQLGNPLFRKLKKLHIHANGSLQLADSYINLKRLDALESLQVDNRSLCLCLNMCLERDSIRLENLKYLICHRINLKIVLKHFPNLVTIKCSQVDCYDRVRLPDERQNLKERKTEEPEADESGQTNGQTNDENTPKPKELKQVKWKHFELNSLVEINEYFYDFLVENCLLLEELKINVSDLDEIILLVDRLKCLKRLQFNCRASESPEFIEKLGELMRLVADRNSKGHKLRVQFNGLELPKAGNASDYNSSHRLKKFLLIKSEFHTLNYYDLIKIDQLCRDFELDPSADLTALFTWCQTLHVNQNVDNLRILSPDHLVFANVRQLFFKASDYDETVNDQQLRLLLFVKLPNLRSLDLSCVQRLKQETLDCIAEACPSLKELSLSSNRSESICLRFLSRLEQLERAEFYACKFAESTRLNELTRDLKYFTYLSITNCDNLIGAEQIFQTMYCKARNNSRSRMEYNLFMDKPHSQIIQKFSNSDRFPQMRNFFFID